VAELQGFYRTGITFRLTSLIGDASLRLEVSAIAKARRQKSTTKAGMSFRTRATYAFGRCCAITKTAGWKAGGTAGY